MTSTAEIETRAAEWLARRDGSDWGPAREAELDAWLAESTANRVAFLRLQAAWARAERLSALRVPVVSPSIDAGKDRLPEPKAVTLPPRMSRRLAKWVIAPPRLAAAAAIAGIVATVVIFMDIGGIGGSALLAGASTYSTEIGAREMVPLADGSKVELNTDTRIRTAVTKERRTVWLDRGEAYFEVVPDTNRPFIVLAGNRSVTVVGTKFAVRRDGDEVQVKVAEGMVHVDALDGPAPPTPTVVTRGDIAVTKGRAILVAERSLDEVQKELSWRQGLLSFDNWTLADAAREFNRYNRKKLIIGDAAAAGIHLGGSFEAGNVEAFARLLEQAYGLHAQIGNEQIVISN
jgi:transmembrane sensor